jgi:hypothetical protein
VLDLTVYRGDNSNFRITMTDTETGDPLVLPTTGWRAQARVDKDSDDILFSLVVDATDAGSGVIDVSVVGDDTAPIEDDRVLWDIENTTVARTYLAGAIRLKGQVSRA